MADSIEFVPQVVVTVAIKDLNAAIAWYGDKLQMPLHYQVDDIGWAEVGSAIGGLTVGLMQNPDAAGVGENVVITLGVADIDAARATMESRGVEFVSPIDEIPGMVKLTSLKDLDGNLIMLAQTLMQAPE